MFPIGVPDVCREHGVEFEQLRNGLEAMGFEPKGAGDHVRTDELEILPLVALSLQTGVLDEAWLVRIGRGYSEALRRLTQAENEVYHFRFEAPLLERGMAQAEAMQQASAMAPQADAGSHGDAAKQMWRACLSAHTWSFAPRH